MRREFGVTVPVSTLMDSIVSVRKFVYSDGHTVISSSLYAGLSDLTMLQISNEIYNRNFIASIVILFGTGVNHAICMHL